MTRQRPITLHPPAAAVRKSFCDPARGGLQREKRLFFQASRSVILVQWPSHPRKPCATSSIGRERGGILPPISSKDRPLSDPIEAMIALRNGLSHGTADLHLPAMAVNVVEACAGVIGIIYPG